MSVPPEQSEAATFLRGLAVADPVETHISLVFLGSDTVWKLKKAVRLSFLDFSRIEDRHRFCEREFALNAPAAPGLYRDVVPIIRRADGGLSLGGDGTVVDWVLRMGRVPAADFLDVMAADGRLKPAVLDAVADSVAAYHQSLPALRQASAEMGGIVRGNVEAALNAGLPADIVATWGASIGASLAALRPWLERRARDGFIRRTHGDLHLGNICFWQRKPVPFDALEFDEALATIDLGYDLAFLLMDLEHRVGRPAANRVLSRYVARTGDVALVRGLSPFLSLRAMVRAHVAQRSGQSETAGSYLASAMTYLRPARPLAIAIGGLPGTGKSTLARMLAPELGASPGALVLRSDEIRKRLHGIAPEERLPQSAYTPDVSRVVFETLAVSLRTAAEAGQAVVADATFMNLDHRHLAEDAARRAGVPFIGFWLQAPMKALEQRVERRTGDASDATVAVLRAAAVNDPGPLDWTPIDASDATNAVAQMRNLLPRNAQPC